MTTEGFPGQSACVRDAGVFPSLNPSERIVLGESQDDGQRLPLSDGCEQADQEAEFYSSYEWSLNPILPLSRMLALCAEEAQRLGSMTVAWQAQECRINLYLLACGISCTVADYLAPGFPSFDPLVKRFPGAKSAVQSVESAFHTAHSLRNRTFDRGVYRWKENWDRCVDLVCEILIDGDRASEAALQQLKTKIGDCAKAQLPAALLQARTQVPSGFRAQDLGHYDFLALTNEFQRKAIPQSLVIVGARTAGSYFAPLAAAKLRSAGWSGVSWLSLRPKQGVSAWESEKLRAVGRSSSHVLVVDDHPETGHTIRLMIGLLKSSGVAENRMTVLVPSHPAQKDFSAVFGGTNVKVVTLPWEQSHKFDFLLNRATPLLEDYFSQQGWTDVRVHEDSSTNSLNEQLLSSCGDSFSVRLKKVFTVSGCLAGEPVSTRVIGKSVGWGWLGYHAYIAGKRLAGLVPPVLGLREGILFGKWLNEVPKNGAGSTRRATTGQIAQYVARRAETLHLDGDPCFDTWRYGSTGWYTLTRTLRAPYGPFFGRMKTAAIRNALRRYVPTSPTFVDARMRPEEWIDTPEGMLKVDYEHHGFGNPSLNVVDPVYDLAAAVFALDLDRNEEKQLVEDYQRLNDDPQVRDRLILHKIVCGRTAQQAARYKLASTTSNEQRRQLEHSWIAARDFLVYQMNQFFAESLPAPVEAQWSDRLVFLDLDGVFDRDAFYFPHTTPTGVQALRRLQFDGFSVVLNSGRSSHHIRNYCTTYNLPGGIGEYGCYFYDAVSNREFSLVPEPAQKQIEQFRALAQATEGIFIDPTHEYGVRIYRMNGSDPVGLSSREISSLLKDFDQLTFLTSSVDTHVLPKGAGKGVGVLAVKEHLAGKTKFLAAIGDSVLDFPMFELVDRSYILLNGSPRTRRAAEGKKIHVIKQHFQKGFEAAVNDIIRHQGRSSPFRVTNRQQLTSFHSHVIADILSARERSWWHQLLTTLNRQSL